MTFVTFVLVSVILGGQAGADGPGGGSLPGTSVANVEALWGALDAKMTSDIVVRYSPSATLTLPNAVKLRGWTAIERFWASQFTLYWTSSHQRTGIWPTHVGRGIIWGGTFTYSVKTPTGTMKSANVATVSVFEFGDNGKLIESQWLYWDLTPLLAANGLCIRPNHTDWSPSESPVSC